MSTYKGGHLRQLSSGNWRWIVQHRGQRRSGTAKTKPAAKVAAAQALVELGAPHPASAGDATIEDLLLAWQAEHADRWSPTYAADVAHVCSHLPAAFLERRVDEVDPAAIAQLQRTLGKAGWSAHRLQRLRGCLSGAWRMAITYGWARTNPVRDVLAPHVDRSRAKAPTPDVVRALVAAAPESLRLFLRLATITGARRGELVGLQWGDIDPATATLTIRRRVVQVAGQAPVVLDSTKTGRKGERRLELDAVTMRMLEQHRDVQREHAARNLLPDPVWVFSSDAGHSPWRPDYPTQTYVQLRRTVAESLPDAEGVRLHDLRHYVATTMLRAGETPADVAAWLGHATPATTMRVYAHVLPGRGRENASRLAGLLDD